MLSMKRKLSKIISLFLTAILLLSTLNFSALALEYGSEWVGYEGANYQKYSDVPDSHWAYEAINSVSDKNWFGGYPDGRFKPDASITRAEALKVFVVFLGLDYQNVDLSDLSYSDISTNDWYAAYVEAGKDLFPVHTTIQGKTPFNPNMPVTREDTIYALVKALGCDIDVKYPDQSVLNMFKDTNSISGNIKAIFSIALMHELVSGFPDGTIRAQAALTRAEFATLLLRGTEHGFHDKYQAKIASVKVFPESPAEIEIGESITLTARATYTDGKNEPYTSLQPYDAENNGVISLAGTTITGLKEGTTTIKYNDTYLKKDSLTVIVKKPTDAPKIKVTEYPEVTELADVTVGGLVEDKDIATVDLVANNKDVRLDSEGNFTTNLSLKIGLNEIKFVATNRYGATAEKTITIERTDVPVLKITDYKQNTMSATTPVSGVVEYYDLSGIRLECNGKNIAFAADGTFTVDVDLELGKNPFHLLL
ncbi:MAG: S-layer homology domain-containing protein [Clostridia bacterium]|nr:S-layer homology domain-containing protein [Clostridia bacterium]